jgi:hypothetical protein
MIVIIPLMIMISTRVVIIITFTWSGPRGLVGHTEVLTVGEAVMPPRPLGSLTPWKTVMICRSVVTTSTESGGASKQFGQNLTVLPMLKLGLLPFLIIL